ncbi:hypothetical protein Plo01_64690 [Planobispora longispora]|uniref:Uncharacterized protein n=1 Tax=Planobispora longispora TaxID=28887 RepID=A0A8J3RRP9_9ACTN|nr:hypothetical protein Plo01_64690 [Planobispora longispora]
MPPALSSYLLIKEAVPRDAVEIVLEKMNLARAFTGDWRQQADLRRHVLRQGGPFAPRFFLHLASYLQSIRQEYRLYEGRYCALPQAGLAGWKDEKWLRLPKSSGPGADRAHR